MVKVSSGKVRCSVFMFSACVCLLMLVVTVVGYNFDTQRASVMRLEDQDAMFGYSVASYRHDNEGWLLVGAPRAQTGQYGVTRGGATYLCRVNRIGKFAVADTRCHQIQFDKYGEMKNSDGERRELKSGQWLGASVAAVAVNNNNSSSSSSNVILTTCAPLFTSLEASNMNGKVYSTVGKCFVLQLASNQLHQYSPCNKVSKPSNFYLRYCQAGFSVALNQDGTKLFYGAVGFSDNQGHIFHQDLNYGVKPVKSEMEVKTEDNSYLGYAMALGRFSRRNSAVAGRGGGQKSAGHQDIVVSAPRSQHLHGKVLILSGDTRRELAVKLGEQFGAYFGYALSVCDVNGDGRDDILISAPLFSDMSTGSEVSYNMGRVYVYYQSEQHVFDKFDHVTGSVSGAMFGLAITSLGDADLDGFDDIAIAAPYSGNGVVYIYQGSYTGILQKPSQIIRSNTISPSLKTFGFSLSGGVDLDGTGYDDLVVGDYRTSSTILLMSRPVVHVKATIDYVNLTGSIDLKSAQSHCPVVKNHLQPCLKIKFCMKYTGANVRHYHKFSVEIRLDTANQQISRLYHGQRAKATSKNFTVRAAKNKTWCLPSPLEVFIDVERSRDKLTPLQATAYYRLVPPVSSSHYGVVEGVQRRPSAVLSPYPAAQVSTLAAIANNCGSDQICQPNLGIILQHKQSAYRLGTKERLAIEVRVHNTGEDAYETMLFLQLPNAVDYAGMEGAVDSASLSVSCKLHIEVIQDTVICSLESLFSSDKLVHFFVHLMPSNIDMSGTNALFFTAVVNSTNRESDVNMKDNTANLRVPIEVNATLFAFGTSKPDLVIYHSSDYSRKSSPVSEKRAGPEAIHTFQLTNHGPSDIIETRIVIAWPAFTADGVDYLLYLMEQPAVSGPTISCQEVLNVNPISLEAEPVGADAVKTNKSLAKRIRDDVSGRSGRSVIQRNTAETTLTEQACPSQQCTAIHCTAQRLVPGDVVFIRLRSRIWSDTLIKYFHRHRLSELRIFSKLTAEITKLPYNVDPSNISPTIKQVVTVVQMGEVLSPSAPLWTIYLSLIGGVFVLTLLILVLHKYGFFERRTLQDKFLSEVENQR